MGLFSENVVISIVFVGVFCMLFSWNVVYLIIVVFSNVFLNWCVLLLFVDNYSCKGCSIDLMMIYGGIF